MAELTSSEKIVYFGKECHTPKGEEISQAFSETSHNGKNLEQVIIDLVKRAYESGYNEGSMNAVKAFVNDADKVPDMSMLTYFEPYKSMMNRILQIKDPILFSECREVQGKHKDL